MKVVVGSDHASFAMKRELIPFSTREELRRRAAKLADTDAAR